MSRFFLFALFIIHPALSQDFYLSSNGVTCMCPNASIGDSGDPGNGIVYTKRTAAEITPQNAATTCTSGIEYMNDLFKNVTDFNSDISSWDVSNVISMGHMFDCYEAGGNYVFDQNLSYWNVSSVTDMSAMFRDCYVFNSDLSGWDTGNVIAMVSMFEFAYNFNSDISSWDVSNVIHLSNMFLGADEFNQPIGTWDVSNVTNMGLMFWGWDATMNFDQDLSTWQFHPSVQLSGFLDLSGMSTSNYDLLLQSLNNQGLSGREIGVDGLIYCNQNDRESLIINGWNFSGDAPLEVIFNAPDDLNISPDPGSCVATIVDLGVPELEACPAYSLSNDAPAEFPLGLTEVNWTLIDNNGVTLSDTQQVEVELITDVVDICYVTAYWNDPTKNRVWVTTNPELNGLNVVHHEVLRENFSGDYELIGTITPPDNAFLDMSSNNNAQSYRYKVRTLNTCGEIFETQDYHKTILLQSSISTDNTVNLSWNPYLGLSYSSYDIYRRLNGGNWEQIASLASTSTLYNDTSANVIENFYEYYIAITVPTCSGLSPLQGFTLRSNFNYVNPNLVIKDNTSLSESIVFYPNPATELINISVSEAVEVRSIILYSALGQQIMGLEGVNSMDVSMLPSGVYYMAIETDQGRVTKSVVRK